MQENDSAPAGQKPNAPLWVKIFVPLHIIAITAWSLPNPPSQYVGTPPKVALRVSTENPKAFFSSAAEYLRTEFLIGNQKYLKGNGLLRDYLLCSGFWQYWDMFSPNPASVDDYCEAMVYYADGSKKLYHYPRIYNLGYWDKFMKERWRKFYERAGSSEYRFLWPVFAQRIALLNFSDPKNPPTLVELHHFRFEIKPPDEPPNTAYSDELYYKYQVDQVALRRDKGQ